MYHLRSLDTGELIRGGLYTGQFQRQRGNIWLIERVFTSRVRCGVLEYFVKWMWFGLQWKEWIQANSITNMY